MIFSKVDITIFFVIWAQVKIMHNSRNHSDVRTWSLEVPKIQMELYNRTHSLKVIVGGFLRF